METVRCAGCGYLTAGNDEGESPTVGLVYRQRGERYGPGEFGNPVPRCHVFARDIQAEYVERVHKDSHQKTKPAIALDVIQEPRKCKSFFQLRPGCSPKEHVMIQQNELLKQEIEARRVEEAERAEQRRRADEELAQRRIAEDREWRAKESELQRRFQARVSILVAVFGAIITLVTTLVTVFLKIR